MAIFFVCRFPMQLLLKHVAVLQNQMLWRTSCWQHMSPFSSLKSSGMNISSSGLFWRSNLWCDGRTNKRYPQLKLALLAMLEFLPRWQLMEDTTIGVFKWCTCEKSRVRKLLCLLPEHWTPKREADIQWNCSTIDSAQRKGSSSLFSSPLIGERRLWWQPWMWLALKGNQTNSWRTIHG